MNKKKNHRLRNNIFKYNRSSYHLGIAYYIYNEKKNEMNQQQLRIQNSSQIQHQNQQQRNTFGQMQGGGNPMMLTSLMQSMNPQINTMQHNSASPPSINQQNKGQQQIMANTNLSQLMQSVKNDGKDINSRVDDLMNS